MKIITLTLLLSFICSISVAQDIAIYDPSVVMKNDKLTIEFSFRLEQIPGNSKLVITPMLIGDNNETVITPIVLFGRTKRISEQRRGVKTDNRILGVANRRAKYSVSIPFEKWMVKTQLKLYREMTICDSFKIYTPIDLLETKIALPSSPKKVIIPENQPLKEFEQKIIEFPFVYPMEQYRHLTFSTKSLKPNGPKLYYKVNESQIDINYNTNLDALMSIRDAITLMWSNESVRLAKIIIYGTASPEGSEVYNKKLAQARADWMVNYISNFVDPSYIETVNLGENWDDLRDFVEQSGMPYKQEVLGIIDNHTVAEGRKQKLMDLHVGIPYRYIKEQFFPQLRCANYIQVFYDKK